MVNFDKINYLRQKRDCLVIKMTKFKYILPLFFFFLSIVLLQAQGIEKKILKAEIKAAIDPRTGRYVKLAFEKAREENVDLILLELDTYGGTLNDADDIRKIILNSKIPVWAFINKNAASAGALIAIACDSIYMASGANIGAATVVTQDGTPAPEKYQSYMRSMMRATAEATGRDPQIAENMVGKNISDTVQLKTLVLTFTTEEAIKNKYCERKVGSTEEIFRLNGISRYHVEEFKLGTAEKIISFFMNPFISGILILIIIAGIYYELQTPGVGFPLIASIIAAVLYFTPYYLNGLAENWEIALFLAGVILIALEIFVIPGFGVAGISGIALTLLSLILVMLNNDFLDFSFVSSKAIYNAALVTLTGLLAVLLLIIFGSDKLAKSKAFRRIALQHVQDSSLGYRADTLSQELIGQAGAAHTVLRPGGKIMIGDTLYDGVTRGEFIDAGTPVVVIGTETTTLRVKAI